MTQYKDASGNPCTLRELVSMDPEWAASRLRFIEPIAKAHATACRALAHYQAPNGNADCQVDMCIEECSELIKALLKLRRYRGHERLGERTAAYEYEIRQELADVQIMVLQMAQLFGFDAFKTSLAEKTERLEKRIAK